MQNSFRHITVLLLTTLMLVAYTGVSVCCAFGCHEATKSEEQAICCEESANRACEERAADGCPDCKATYVSLDVEFSILSSDFQLPSLICSEGNMAFLAISVNFPKTKIAPLENDLPPPPYGKALLPWVQSFLC